LKLNFVGAKNSHGIGVAFNSRNHEGFPIMAGKIHLSSSTHSLELSSNQTETHALWWCLTQVTKFYQNYITIEGDSMWTLNSTLRNKPRWNCWSWYHDIIKILSTLQHFHMLHSWSEANFAVDQLAKEAATTY